MTIHKKHAVTRDVHDLACSRLEHCFKTFDTVAVFFSGGKDSTVCLNLAIEVARALGKLPLQAMTYDEEAIPPETAEYCRRVVDTQPLVFQWLCLPIKSRNACSRKSPWWYPWAEEDRAKWTRELPPDAIRSLPGFGRILHRDAAGFIYPPSYGRVCTVMGIRTQESLNRYMAIAGNKTGHRAFLSGDHWRHITRAYPIYDWAHEDVWYAPQRFGWDYNRAYDVMQRAGVPIHNQRCAPPFAEQPLERLWTYAVCWPELWDKMTARVPGANTAGRYARTSLYGYGGNDGVVKPDNQTWREFVQSAMDSMAPGDKAAVASGVKQLLDDHKLYSDDPLPEVERHPHSGMSWALIGQLVVRRDLKGRKVLAMRAAARKWVMAQRTAARNAGLHHVETT